MSYGVGQLAKPSLSVIIPAFNEAGRLPSTLDASIQYLTLHEQRRWEILVVDDGSADETAKTVCEFGLGANLRLLRSAQNHGKGAALRAGAAMAVGERLLLMDADGGTPISALSSLEREMQASSADIVVGSRAEMLRRRPWRRQLMGRVFAICASTCVRGLDDTQCGFKLVSRAAASSFAQMHVERWAFDVELLYIAQQRGFFTSSATVPYCDVSGSKVTWSTPVQMFVDVARVFLLYRLGFWKRPQVEGRADDVSELWSSHLPRLKYVEVSADEAELFSHLP